MTRPNEGMLAQQCPKTGRVILHKRCRDPFCASHNDFIPMGINLFVTSKITKIPFELTFKYLIPMLVALIITLFIVTFVPQLSLCLPSLIK